MPRRACWPGLKPAALFRPSPPPGPKPPCGLSVPPGRRLSFCSPSGPGPGGGRTGNRRGEEAPGGHPFKEAGPGGSPPGGAGKVLSFCSPSGPSPALRPASAEAHADPQASRPSAPPRQAWRPCRPGPGFREEAPGGHPFKEAGPGGSPPGGAGKLPAPGGGRGAAFLAFPGGLFEELLPAGKLLPQRLLLPLVLQKGPTLLLPVFRHRPLQADSGRAERGGEAPKGCL